MCAFLAPSASMWLHLDSTLLTACPNLPPSPPKGFRGDGALEDRDVFVVGAVFQGVIGGGLESRRANATHYIVCSHLSRPPPGSPSLKETRAPTLSPSESWWISPGLPEGGGPTLPTHNDI